MRIFIGCSSKNNIDKKYFKLTSDICTKISKNNDLVFGADTNGMMGVCYKIFKENNRKIIAIVNEHYKQCLENIFCDKKLVTVDTFDRTQKIYNESDLFLILPGGIGSLGELLSILENRRNMDDGKKIIIYNFENYYDELLEMLNKAKDLNFVDTKDLDYIKIINKLTDLDFLTNN